MAPILSQLRFGQNAPLYLLLAGAVAGLTTVVASVITHSNDGRIKHNAIPSPGKTVLRRLSAEQKEQLPYPPDVLPGGRDVETPYGTIKVFEWGPEDGERVLLMHGIGTPCLALGNMAREFVASGYRVMLFDFFGRGYSDAPTGAPYDIRLYTTQILLVLSSSRLPWTGDDAFHLVGYSLGGGVAASFATYFPRMLRSLTVVAGGGLIRRGHVGWRSKLLYSGGILPEWLREALVKIRLRPPPLPRSKTKSQTQSSTDDNQDGEDEEPATGPLTEQQLVQDTYGGGGAIAARSPRGNSDATGGHSFDHAKLTPTATVADVMAWQLRHHDGFVHAFMSSIRHAPIYEQREDWARLGALLAERRKTTGTGWEDVDGDGDGGEASEGKDKKNGGSKKEGEHAPAPGLGGGKMLVVLGASDQVVVKEEIVHDVGEVLGEDGFEVAVIDAGHEVVIVKGNEVARAAMAFWMRRQPSM